MTHVRRQFDIPDGARAVWALRWLASGLTEAEVAAALDIRPETLARWLADQEFAAMLDYLKEHKKLFAAFARLLDLTPDAIAALERALSEGSPSAAVQAAREVLDRVGFTRRALALAARTQAESPSRQEVIEVEYATPDRQALSAAPWADRNPEAPGALQGGGVWPPLRQDGDGQDPGD